MTIKKVLDTFIKEQLEIRYPCFNRFCQRTKDGRCPLEVAYQHSAGTIGIDNIARLDLEGLSLTDAKRLMHWADTGRWTEYIKL